MTHNQIDYGRLMEEKRHNLVTESETQRHNVRVEDETSRHNVADETETRRHNIVNEIEVNRHNVVSESEVQRHNRVTESETARINSETIRHNQASEALQRYSISVQERANSINEAHYTRQDRQNATRLASDIAVNNARISNLTAQTARTEAQTAQQEAETAVYTGSAFRLTRVTSSNGNGGGFHGGSWENGSAYAALESVRAKTARATNQITTDTMNSTGNLLRNVINGISSVSAMVS